MEQEHPPDEVCWVQPTDSLVFSVSPVGRSTSNNIRVDGNDDGNSLNSRDEGGDDEDHPLIGEYIWDDRGGHSDDVESSEAAESGNICDRLVDSEEHPLAQGSIPPRCEKGCEEGSGEAQIAETCENSRASQGQNHDGEIRPETPQGSPRGIEEYSNSSRELWDRDNDGDEWYNPHVPPGFGDLEWDAVNENEGWVNDDEGDFAPAWDQGRPVEFRSTDDEDGGIGTSNLSNEVIPADFQCQPHDLVSGINGGNSDADSNSSGSSSINSSTSSSSTSSNRSSSNGGVVEQTPRGRDDSFSRGVRHRTRLSLVRERRRLDRIPRSQRLSQVKGHPLGGMTLLELEERHLLDVGIGQMTRQMAKRRAGGIRQADADLLRRSARLLRRAQEEREARLFFEEKRENHRHGKSSRALQNSSTLGKKENSSGREGRRPASASREPRRVSATGFSLDSEDSSNWGGTSKYRPVSTGARARTGEGVPPVGLYSGGGARCSLKQRRPMSAKPALTCGSGWEPGKTKTRHRGDRENGFGDSRRTHRTHVRGVEETGAGGLQNMSDGSDLSDLSPHGIVEYTDEEEGPFNVDELERVAASYLLRPRGSICHSLPAEVDDRFADDGSVYIYREGDGSPPGYAEGKEEINEEVQAGSNAHNRSNFARDCDRDQENGWKEGGREASYSARTRDSGNFRDSFGRVSDADRRRISREIVIGGADPLFYEQANNEERESGERETKGKDKPYGSCSTYCRSDTAACTHINNRPEEERELCSSSPEVNHVGVGDKSQFQGAYLASDAGTRGKDLNNILLENCSSRPENYGRNDVLPQVLVPVPVPVPGANYSSKMEGEVQGRGRDKALAGEPCDETGVNNSAKVGQVTIRLRQMILDRQASANRSIRQVFSHFDRRGCGYVNATEIRDALGDLRLDLTPNEAKELHSLIALDGGDRLSYGEFAVFVSDPYHSDLQVQVCQQAAEQLEAFGRRSFNLDTAFHLAQVDSAVSRVSPGAGVVTAVKNARDDSLARRDARMQQGASAVAAIEGRVANHYGSASGERQIVSTAQFAAGLKGLGLQLSPSDVQRLLVRFDVHGDGYLSVGRFVSMVESSRPWTRALTQLAHQEEADEEADAYLRAHRVHGRWPAGQALSTDIVEMARYIGIRVSSDASLLWIAADAVAAPLPDGWVMHDAQDGRWFYHNKLTGQSRWDHPLDPHFRHVYLNERFGTIDADENFGHELSETFRGLAGRCKGVGAEGACGQTGAAHVSSQPPTMLPPCRIRPSVLDFPADKAIGNLRTRRLNGTGSGMLMAAKVAAKELTVDPHTIRTNREHWVGKGSRPASPSRPRRRRPVSASALREGREERSRGLKAPAIDMGPLGGGSGFSGDGVGGFEVTTITEVPHVGRQNCLDDTGRELTARPRRPLSAKASLQGPATGHQSGGKRRRGEQDNLHQLRKNIVKKAYPPRRQPEAPYQADKGWTVQEMSNAAEAAADSSLHDRDPRGRFGSEGSYKRDDEDRVRRSPPEIIGVGTACKIPASDSETADFPTTVEEERAWLLDRLADLYSKLGNAETLARGSYECSSASRKPRRISSHAVERCPGRSRPNVSNGKGAERGTFDVTSQREGKFLHKTEGLSSSASDLLRGHMEELSSRIGELETRLQEQAPPRDDGLYSRRSHGFINERDAVEQRTHQVPNSQQHSGHWSRDDGTVGSSSGKISSQDDLVYIAPGRGVMNSLSKQSWPPTARVTDNRRPSAYLGSSGSSSESFLIDSGKRGVAPHIFRWENSPSGTGKDGRGRVKQGEEKGRGTRSNIKRGGANPPGIVLI